MVKKFEFRTKLFDHVAHNSFISLNDIVLLVQWCFIYQFYYLSEIIHLPMHFRPIWNEKKSKLKINGIDSSFYKAYISEIKNCLFIKCASITEFQIIVGVV